MHISGEACLLIRSELIYFVSSSGIVLSMLLTRSVCEGFVSAGEFQQPRCRVVVVYWGLVAVSYQQVSLKPAGTTENAVLCLI